MLGIAGSDASWSKLVKDAEEQDRKRKREDVDDGKAKKKARH